MILSDLPFGAIRTLEIERDDGSAFDFEATPGLEVELARYATIGQDVLATGGSTVRVRGKNAADQHALGDITVRNLPRLAWLVSRTPDVRPTSLVVQVHSFPLRYTWDEPLDLCVDAYTRDEIRRVDKPGGAKIETAIRWLTQQLLVASPDPNAPARLFLSAGASPGDLALERAFRLHAPDYAIDVARGEDDLLRIKRVLRRRPDRGDEPTHPILLVEAPVRFCREEDATEEGKFRGRARTQIEAIVQKSGSYLQVWKDYRQIEAEVGLAESREIGALRYEGWTRTPGGRFRFQLVDDGGLADRLKAIRDRDATEFEADLEKPDWLAEGAGPAADEAPPARGRGPARKERFGGKSAKADVNLADRAITLDRVKARRSPPEPPQSGYLFHSRKGEEVRQKRREAAEKKIIEATCPMPQLGMILEDIPVPIPRQKWIDPSSPRVRRTFKRPPTPKQLEAIEIALNTPDIALIQGPPGTGKTTVISALLARLAEIADTSDGIAGVVLLTSFQHEAVQNAVERTKVFGLSPKTFGGRREQAEQAVSDNDWAWAAEQIARLREVRRQFPEPAVTEAYRRVQAAAVRYVRATGLAEETVGLLERAAAAASEYLSGPTRDRLLDEIGRIRRETARQSPSDEVEAAFEALRALRVDPVAFADDGPSRARRALARLRGLPGFDQAATSTLRAAAEWASPDPPPFLDDLAAIREGMIQRLLPDDRPRTSPSVDASVRALLDDVVRELETLVRSTRQGPGAVIDDYIHDLEHDPAGVRRTLGCYASIYAVTLGQSVAGTLALLKGDLIYDTVVVDEAARANPLDLFLVMVQGRRRIILVGDHRQLPQSFEQSILRELEGRMADITVNAQTLGMLTKSLFERLFIGLPLFPDKISRTITLDTQFRMHGVLGDYVSAQFYEPHGEKIKSVRPPEEFRHHLPRFQKNGGDVPAAWIEVPAHLGPEQGSKSKERPAEAPRIAQEVGAILERDAPLSVGVISFYSAQTELIVEALRERGIMERTRSGPQVVEKYRLVTGADGRVEKRLEVATVDAFQGKEFDVVFLSMTRSNDRPQKTEADLRRRFGHLMLPNRMCVAMSRQRRLLVMVGDPGMLAGEPAARAIGPLLKFHELCGGEHGIRI